MLWRGLSTEQRNSEIGILLKKRIDEWYMPSEPHGEGDIAVELWKKLEPGEK